jgi:hypothetical protein
MFRIAKPWHDPDGPDWMPPPRRPDPPEGQRVEERELVGFFKPTEGESDEAFAERIAAAFREMPEGRR